MSADYMQISIATDHRELGHSGVWLSIVRFEQHRSNNVNKGYQRVDVPAE